VTATQEAEATDTLEKELNVLPAESSEDSNVGSPPGGLVAGAPVAEVAYSKKKQYWLFDRSLRKQSSPAEDVGLLTQDVASHFEDVTGPTQENDESTAIPSIPELSSSPVAGSELAEVRADPTGVIVGTAGAEVDTPSTNERKKKKQYRFFSRGFRKY
jgi:hypothetical protein